jgi:cysteine desulfuration protein SufE
MSIGEIQDQVIKEFEDIDNWEDRYKHIIKLGRELPGFPDDKKTEENQIKGCQSQVWMYPKLDGDKVYFVADSDAMIVKGLIAILLRVYSGHSPDEILNSPPEFIQKIGIDKHLSPTRKNGLSAMLKQIKMYAIAYKSIVEKNKVSS